MFKNVQEESAWNGIFKDKRKNKLFRTVLGKTKIYKSPRQAIYHKYILNERNGVYNLEDIMKEDGSLKPYNIEEASPEDRKKVFDLLKNKDI
jgi:hypothetical protein